MRVQDQDQLINKSDNSQDQDAGYYKQYSYRYYLSTIQWWVTTAIFTLSALVGSMMVQACTPIVEELSDAYGVSATAVKLTALIFMVTHPFFTMTANWVVESLGLKAGVTVGAVLVISGLAVRLLVNKDFYWVIAGAVICSAGNVFVLNTPTKVASNWWFPENRVAVTTVCMFANLVSGAIGTIMPSLIFDKDDAKETFWNLMFVQFLIIGSVFILNILLFKQAPPTPPSYSASQPREPFLKALPVLIKNYQYIKLVGASLIVIGSMNSLFVNIESSLKPFGFGPKDVTLISICSTFFGIIGSAVSIIYIKRFKKYKLTIGIYLIIGIFAFIGMGFILYTENLWLLAILVGFASFSLYPVIPNCIELACELLYPIGEATATGTLLASGQIASFIIGILISTYVIDGVTKINSFIGYMITAGLLLLSLILVWSIDVTLKRDQQDQAHGAKQSLTDM